MKPLQIALRIGAGLVIAVLTYFGMEYVTWRAYYADGCEKMFAPGCMRLLYLKHLVAAAFPGFLTGWWIGRRGAVLGAAVALGGWLIVNLLQPLLGPNSFDAWHLVPDYLIIGALAGWIGQLVRSRRRASR